MSETTSKHVRSITLQYRDQGADKPPVFTGYASTFNEWYSVHDWLGEYRERIAPGAFDRALSENADVRLLINHEGLPIARTSSGTLHLSIDAKGLLVRAELDSSDPDVQALIPKMRRGDVREMSFAFIVPRGGDEWNESYTERTVRDLEPIDVSVVTFPANRGTSANVRKHDKNMSTKQDYESVRDIPDELNEKLARAAQEHGAPAATTQGIGEDFAEENYRGLSIYIDHLEEQVKNGLASEKRAAEGMLPVAKMWRAFHRNNMEQRDLHARTVATHGGGSSVEYRAVSAGGTLANGEQYRGVAHVGAEQVYRPDGTFSFFQDTYNAQRGDWKAADRLARNNAAQEHNLQSYRAVSTSAGSGGAFAPPAWLVDEWIKLARPGRIAADMNTQDLLPGGVSSINLPKVATGTTVGVTVTQNTAISNTDITSTSVSSGITTISGQQVVSMQMLAQSPIPFDRIILSDLSRAYAAQLDTQVISGTGADGQLRGILTATYTSSVTWTTASPAVVSTTAAASFYNQIVKAANNVHTGLYAAPTAILMHPRRWAWVLQALDTTNRPLVLSEGGEFNAIGANAGPIAQGVAGTLANLPVYVDPNIPTTLGVSTNQDVVIVAKFDELHLWESPMAVESFTAPYAANMSVLFRVYAYSAYIPDRQAAAVSVISGTGLVAPSLG